MQARSDPRIDELRDLGGDLFGRAPAQQWVKPVTVALRQKTFRHVLEGALRNGSELEFVLPWTAPTPRCVRPSKSILEGFLSLASAKDEEIRDFAARYGPLLIFCKVKELEEHAVIIEGCEVWRYFAACMRSLLHIAARLASGRSLGPGDWDVIGWCPMAVARTEADGYDWLNPSPVQEEKAWKIMAAVISKGRNRDRAMWARLLNALLGLGRVRPWVNLDGSGGSTRSRLTFTGPNLLSYLALQLCLTASKHEAFAVCSHCTKEYSPTRRAPKFGQNNFCPECRAGGVPVKMAQRAHRERLREKR
jgi:hypothetical protein